MQSSFKHLLAALTAVVAVSAVAQSTPVFAGNTGNPNDPAYWEAQLGDGASCVKHDPGDTTPDGVITGGGTSVTLNPGNWALLVVNSGAGGPDRNGNLVYHDPVVGTAYFGPLNGGGQQGDVSHWIVCSTPTAPQPDPDVTETEWIDGAWECGDTTVAQTRTVTTTPYVLIDNEWQLDDANTVTKTETQTRTLTADEQISCDVPAATQSPAFVEPTCTADAEIILPGTAGVTYTASAPAAAGATVTVTATAQPGYALTGSTEWSHTFGTVDESQCVDSGALPPTTETPSTTQPPTTTDPLEVDSDAPTTSVAPTTQLPKTGNDHVTLVGLIAALLLGGGVALSAMAARRRS